MIKPIAIVTIFYFAGATPTGQPDAGIARAQARSTTQVDAGRPPVDAGVAAEPVASIVDKQMAADMKAQAQQLEQLRAELQAQRDRTARLEDRLAQVDGLTGQLGELIKQVQGVRGDLQTAASEKSNADARTQQHLADTRQAIDGLLWAENQLAYGSGDIQGTLDHAASVMTDPRAAADLQYARSSLANNDLQAVRLYLYQAILDSQSTLINPR